MRNAIAALIGAAGALALNGCVALGLAAVGAGAGYVAYDESTEDDGKFDPLEDVRDEEDGRN